MKIKAVGELGLLPRLRRKSSLMHVLTLSLFPGLIQWNTPLMANPQGAAVVYGDVSFGGSASNLQILQGSQNAIINWDSFSIQSGELTQFRQPNSNAAVLNRVTGGDPSAIHGALKANGNVFVINPNGILVGPSGTIDVHGLVLSTLDVSNGEFLARGDMTFKGSSGAGITNLGRINAIGGDVFLIGKTVTNSGTVAASGGRVGMAAGEEVLLTASEGANGERMFVRAKGSTVGVTGIYNDGSIEAAAVELKAHGNVYALAINNKGSIRATGSVNRGGRVYLKGAGGTVQNSGSIRATSSGVGSGGRVLIEAAYAKVDGMVHAEGGQVRVAATNKAEMIGNIDATNDAGKGGEIIVEASDIYVAGGARMDASGTTGGGDIYVGGGFQGRDAAIANADQVVIDDGAVLRSSAVNSGEGGRVIVWSDGDTLFRGNVEAEGHSSGGFVEISGRENLGFHGMVSTLAADGTAGTLLLDPTNGTVSSATHDTAGSPFNINTATLQTALASNNVVISTPSAGSDPGHVTFSDSVIWNSDFSLTTLAHGDITFEASVQNQGTGGINVVAGWDGTTGLLGSSPYDQPGSVNIGAFLDDHSSFGGSGGSVKIGTGSQTNGVAVGSRQSDTVVLGYGIQLLGGTTADSYAQIGYRPTGSSLASSGNLVLGNQEGGLKLQGGTAKGAYAQVGHGGYGSSNAEHSGNIKAFSVVSSNLEILGGSGNYAYAQIGHGGGEVTGVLTSGTITVGASVFVDGPGTLRVDSAGAYSDVSLEAGSNAGENAYSQIGHGGALASEKMSGDISLGMTGDLTLAGGKESSLGAYAQIGHGGRRATGTERSGDITVATSGGAINLTGGDAVASDKGGDAYVSIGHGGRSYNGVVLESDIRVSAAGTIKLTAGQGKGATGRWAQIGHGGLTVSSNASATGIIEVVSEGGNIELQGGHRNNSYVQIGHGGRNGYGDHSGSILVRAAYSILGTGGDTTSAQTGVMIGHGGSAAVLSSTPEGHHGDIEVVSLGGDIIFTAKGGSSSPVQIGHGGNDSPGNHGLVGETIVVKAEQGEIKFEAGSGSGAYAQIGNGGVNSPGDHQGSIIVTARDGISFQAGSGANSYAQIGNGGANSPGNTVGNITVTAHDGIFFQAGSGANSYAQIGHGGYLARGTNEGSIQVEAVNLIRFQAGTLGLHSYAQIGHGGSDSALLGTGPGTLVNTGAINVSSTKGAIEFYWAATDTLTSNGTYAQLGHGGYLSEGIAAGGDNEGAIRVSAGTNITFRSTTGGVTTAGTTSEGNYVQLGHGGLRWTGDDSGAISVRAGAAGSSGSIVFTAGDGTTGNAGVDNLSNPSNGATGRYAQLGHGGAFAVGSHDGEIDVLSLGNITFTAGRNPQAYAQLGHGGIEASAPAGATVGNSGDIRVVSTNGSLTFQYSTTSTSSTEGIPGVSSYLQLGHGGHKTEGSNVGDIYVHIGGNILFRGVRATGPTGNDGNFVQLGHGGYMAVGSHSGNITVTAGKGGSYVGMFDINGDGIRENVTVTANGAGTVTFNSGYGTDRYAQLGHGGRGAKGDHGAVDAAGNALNTISVKALGTIEFRSYGGSRSYTQIGNGGYDSDPLTNPRGAAADIEVISQTGQILFNTSTSGYTYGQIGNGGAQSTGDHRGEIRVEAGSNIIFTSSQTSTGSSDYVQIGHGGYGSPGNHSGNITVRAGTGGAQGDLRMTAGRYSYRYAQVGHGGYGANGNHTGTIEVEAWGDIGFTGGDYRVITNTTSAPNVATAAVAGGNSPGTLPVTAYIRPSSITITIANPKAPAYATIVDDGKGNLLDRNGNKVGTINYVTGSVAFTNSIANTGSTATAGFQEFNYTGAYAQLGHGGYSVTATKGQTGDIKVAAGLGGVKGDINFQAGAGYGSYAQLGMGGLSGAGDHSGDIWVDALGDIRFSGNINRRTYAQLGHGGYDNDLTTNVNGYDSAAIGNSGDIYLNTRTNLLTNKGGIYFTAGSGSDAYAQLGHGGYGTKGINTGNLTLNGKNVIRVYAAKDIVFLSGDGSGFGVDTPLQIGNGRRAYAQLGHGGYDADANNGTGVDGQGHQAEIDVRSGGKIRFEAKQVVSDPLENVNGPIAASFYNYVQLGHGGVVSSGDHKGSITVDAANGITFQAGGVQPGATANTNHPGYAQLGHGGYNSPGYGASDTRGEDGNIKVRAGVDDKGNIINPNADIIFNAGNGNYSYVLLGHGGYTVTGGHRGDIDVRAGGEIAFTSGGNDPLGDVYASTYLFSQIGHGGSATSGTHNGSITVISGIGGITFLAGAGADSYSMIGHGGRSSKASATDGGGFYGDIRVESQGSITFRAGTYWDTAAGHGTKDENGRNFAMIGHGGYDADVNGSTTYTPGAGHNGSITVTAHDGDITFAAGSLENGSQGEGYGRFHWAQIGHGGYSTLGDHWGSITVTAENGNIQFTGGESTDNDTYKHNYAMLGHGGTAESATATAGNKGRTTDIISVTAGGSPTDGKGSILFTAGKATTSFAQLGNGGYYVYGDHSGEIRVKASNEIKLLGLGATYTYAQLGHGGRIARGDHSGNIEVEAFENIEFTAGTASTVYAQLGHGGYDADSANDAYYPDNDASNKDRGPTDEQRVGNNGAITVETIDGSIVFTTGTGTNTYVQLGHGGNQTDGDHDGDITVKADVDRSNAAAGGGNITFLANTTGSAHYAQLGHGGYQVSGGSTGKIDVEAGGAITFTAGGTSDYVQIGHGGIGDHRVRRGGSSPNYSQANSNDRYYPGTHSGDIIIRAAGDIDFTAGTGEGAFGQIGHGGFRYAAEAGEGHSGAISVISGGGIDFLAQSGTLAQNGVATGNLNLGAFAQIGHGGYESFGNHGYQVVRSEGGLDVASHGGSAALLNGALAPGSVKVTVDAEGIGAGKAVFVDDRRGNLIDADNVLGAGAGTIVATINYETGVVNFTSNVNAAGDSVEVAYLHGGSDIIVDSAEDITFKGGSSASYAQIGHGGQRAAFSTTRVTQPEQASPASYTSSETYHLNTPIAAPLGNSGNITVLVGTGETKNANAVLSFESGPGNDSYAQIGHGGRDDRGAHRGDIEVDASGDIIFHAYDEGAITQSQSSATLDARLVTVGTYYTVSQTANVELGGNFVITYSNPLPGFSGKIIGDGEGNLYDNGILIGTVATNGRVTINIPVSSGTPAAVVTYDHFNTGLTTYVQIGHGGYNADAAEVVAAGDRGHQGDITVRSTGGDIDFKGGTRSNAYAMIGNGGTSAEGDHSGNITVEALGANQSVRFEGGSHSATFAQVGHGGYSLAGNFSGDITVNAGKDVLFSASQGRTYNNVAAPRVADMAITGDTGGTELFKLPSVIYVSPGSIQIVITNPTQAQYSEIHDDGHGKLLDRNGNEVGTINYNNSSVVFTAPIANAGSEAFATYTHGNYSYAYAQVGHGGASISSRVVFDVSGNVTSAGHHGDIRVAAGLGGSGDVVFEAGKSNNAHAIVGHGGYSVKGDHIGDIWVDAPGVIQFTGGEYIRGFAVIGHGGYDSDLTGTTTLGSFSYNSDPIGSVGDIFVNNRGLSATHSDILFTAGGGQQGWVQIGHGGYGTKGSATGNMSATGKNIISVKTEGDIKFTSGKATGFGDGSLLGYGRMAYAQIGHGGYDSDANNATGVDGQGFNANITVKAGGAINFVGGEIMKDPTGVTNGPVNASYYNYVQIGHGGYGSNGDHRGTINVEAETGILFQSGDLEAGSTANTSQGSYAQLGHGGYGSSGYAASDGSQSWASGDPINVKVNNGNLRFLAGNNNNGFVQLGHGGRGTRGDFFGKIDVDVSGDIEIKAGTGTYQYAQLGHGGYDADDPNSNAERGNDGDIVVTSRTGDISFTSGATTATYAQLGHGGYATQGANTGAITVKALKGAIAFTAVKQFVQLGHGGRESDGDHYGTITVEALGDGITFLAGAEGTAESFAQLGHGGRTTRGDFGGEIKVTSYGDIVFTGGNASQNYAQLGHGGYDADNPNPTSTYGYATDPGAVDGPPGFPTAEERVGNNGNITVLAGVDKDGNILNPNSSILFTSGATTNTYVQIGHGGTVNDGDHIGNITVKAAKDIKFDAEAGATTGDYRYAQIGHGGLMASGGHRGNIAVDAGGTITFLSGRSYAYAQIGHGGLNRQQISSSSGTAYLNPRYYPGTHTGDIEVHADGDILFQANDKSTSGSGYAQLGHGGYMNAAILWEGHNGDITVTTDGSLTFNGGIAGTAYAQLGHGGYNAYGNHGRLTVQSESSASLTMVATTGGTASLENEGLAPGSVVILINGDETFYDDGRGGLRDSDGDLVGLIDYEKGTISSPGGVPSGATVAVRYNYGSSDIVVEAKDGIAFNGGSGSTTYAQLGHGGYDADFQVRTRRALGQSGNTTSHFHLNTPVLPTGAVAGLFGGTTGNITVRAGVDENGVILNSDADIVFTSGTGASSYTQLGNGGRSTSGSHQGDLDVQSAADILFTAGAGNAANSATYAYSQLGNGGILSYSDGMTGYVGGHSGDIKVAAGLAGGVGGIAFTAGGNSYNYVQLGHGGGSTSATVTSTTYGSHHGNITVTSGAFDSGAEVARGIVFRSGTDNRAYSQLGHGGSDIVTNGTGDDAVGLKGDIYVASAGDILFVAGTVGGKDIWDNTDGVLYTQLGHGGYNADTGYDRSATNLHGRMDSEGDPVGHGGDITVISGGSIEFLAADATRAYEPSAGDNYGRLGSAQLGHGGYSAVGNHWGNITVQAGVDDDFNIINPDARIYFAAGSATSNRYDDHNNYAQLGNGGRSATGNSGRRDDDNNALDTISVSAGGEITFTASVTGVNNYVILGNGGYAARGDHFANIEVFAGKDIVFEGGMMPYDPTAGGGAYNQYSWTGANASTSSSTYTDYQAYGLDWAANLHTGVTNPNPVNGVEGRVNIRESRVEPGSIKIAIRDNDGNIVAIMVEDGNNGLITDRNIVGVDFGDGAGSVNIAAGTRVADIGNGADGVGHSLTGRTHITFLRDMNPGASDGSANLAIEFYHHAGDRSYAQLGNGGYDADQPDGNATLGNGGDISVVSLEGDILFNAGNQNYSYALLGHGGYVTQGTNIGDIQVLALDGSVEITAGTRSGTWAMIGHGARDATGNHTGAIRVGAAGGDVRVSAGIGSVAYAQIGHGGYATKGDKDGEIIVRAAGEVALTASSGTAPYAMIGHGGYDADGNYDGDIIVSSGSGSLGTFLGMGLFDDLGDYDAFKMSDDIQFADGFDGHDGVTLTGGSASESFAMIGHGGRSSGNANSTNAAEMKGKIGVEAAGDIVLAGGGGTRSYTQIGHGGYEANTIDLTLSGDISVISQEGTLKLLAGTGSDAWSFIGHGASQSAVTGTPRGTRAGAMYIEAGSWELSQQGTALAQIGHRSLNANNGIVGAYDFTVVGSGANGVTSHLIDETFASARDHAQSGGDVTFVGVDLTMDLPLDYQSSGAASMIAMGDLNVQQSVENSGDGDVSMVAGWDPETAPLDFLDKVPSRKFDVAAILADPDAWGNNEGTIVIGGGTQTYSVGVGSALGTTTVLGYGVELIGSDVMANGYAHIGAQPRTGVSPTGDIIVTALEGGIALHGGSFGSTYAQIGHRSSGSQTPDISGDITVRSHAGLSMAGGSGINTVSQIGHGGAGATSNAISGEIEVLVADDLEMLGGTSGGASAQIGHGGYATKADMSGDIIVDVGGNIEMEVVDVSRSAYVKVGHGDDLRDSATPQSGTGERDGDIILSAGEDVSILGGMVGHVNDGSSAVATGGITTIAPARNDPADPSAGSLYADENSVFAGEEELRFYLPRRENNQIAAGSEINGVSYDGGASDPWPIQRPDEFTNYKLTSAGLSQPREHNNLIGSGQAPSTTSSDNFAFYYDLIELGGSFPPDPSTPGPSTPGGSGNTGSSRGNDTYLLDDRALEDWIRDQENLYRRSRATGIYYEGFYQYGYHGESVYQYGFDDAPGLDPDEEDVLRRHLRQLDEARSGNSKESSEAGGGGE